MAGRAAGAPSDPLVRMLTLLPWLRARGPVELNEVAEHFGISQAQLQQELATLTFVGPGQGGGELVDISYEDGLITVHDSQGLEFPLRLSTEEAVSLITGLSLLTELPSGDTASIAATTALAKLEEASGSALGQEPALVLSHDHAPAEVEDAVRDALRDGVRLRIWYAGAARDALTEREVEPLTIVVVDGRTYLEAWCLHADGVRLFRLDRVARVEVTGVPIDPEARTDTRVDPDSARQPDGQDVRLHLTAAAAHVTELKACVGFERLPDGSIDATVRVADPDWLIRLVLSLGSDARLVDEPALADAAAQRAREALAAYDMSD